MLGRRGALLTAKIAKKLGPQATVVSWNPTHGQSDDHMKLLRVMDAENVIFTTAKLTVGRLAAAAVAPQKFETCLIQADVLFDLLVITKHLDDADQSCELQLLYDLAALLIKACNTAFVQVSLRVACFLCRRVRDSCALIDAASLRCAVAASERLHAVGGVGVALVCPRSRPQLTSCAWHDCPCLLAVDAAHPGRIRGH